MSKLKQLKFNHIKAKNFLCFGEQGVEIDFKSCGNIVLIKGKNLDVIDDENDKEASNASGKSSLAEIPVYALFGKTIKKPKKLSHADVINNQANKKLMVEFCWDEYKVIRTRKPDSLRLWKDEVEISKGGIPATQELIENIIGLSYETFINVYIFSDDNTMCFLECDGPTKREIVENLLSLEKYHTFYENSKTFVKTIKENIKENTKTLESLLTQQDNCNNRLTSIDNQEKDWETKKQRELTLLKEKLKKYETTDKELFNYQQIQKQKTDLNLLLSPLEEKKTDLLNIMAKGSSKYKNLILIISEKTKNFTELQKKYDNILKNQKIIDDINEKNGKECPYCFNTIDETKFVHILEKAKKEITDLDLKPYQKELDKLFGDKSKLEEGIKGLNNKIEKNNKEIIILNNKISELNKVKEPKTSINEQQILDLENQIVDKEKELSPYEQIKNQLLLEIEKIKKDIEENKVIIKKHEEDLPYYEFWVKAYGDEGIRKYVIDSIIPMLNSRVAYWLQFLVDGKIRVEFDNQLEEIIDRFPFKGRKYVYHGLSGGQRRRLNLAISQAFAYIMMLNSGFSPSVVFLDEVSTNMDEMGVYGIYKMICELAKEKQVFVIDHKESLLQLLDGCEKIQLEMKNEVSKKL